ncbi:hypothetical protein FB45DRAFT_557844 [Roridomyces roridus]|uniref:KN homeodomain domain-containing protein n=1 Tax=Roridomyces roridus TaxID=1738132 RepID=A0AAD7FLH8_9AGAR|nr:hypothetical protein FB45DRAFT_557844 [Roridomyces roridus]
MVGCPSYIEPAYEWLLNHLDNPYPKTAVKQKIADDTGFSLEHICGWFVEARRRIGWTQLLREEFSRRRGDMVDAAERFFVRPDPESPLLPAIGPKFAQIRACAEHMYTAKFIPSAFPDKIKDPTREVQADAQGKLQAQREAARSPPAEFNPSFPVSDEGASMSHEHSTSGATHGEHLSNKRLRIDDGRNAIVFRPSPAYSVPSFPRTCKRPLSDADESDAKRVRVRATSEAATLSLTLSGTPDLLADWFSSNSTGDTDLLEPDTIRSLSIHSNGDTV